MGENMSPCCLNEALKRSLDIAKQCGVSGKSWVRKECIGGREFNIYVSVEAKDSRTIDERVTALEECFRILDKRLSNCQADRAKGSYDDCNDHHDHHRVRHESAR